jgi:hypothetical protein
MDQWKTCRSIVRARLEHAFIGRDRPARDIGERFQRAAASRRRPSAQAYGRIRMDIEDRK